MGNLVEALVDLLGAMAERSEGELARAYTELRQAVEVLFGEREDLEAYLEDLEALRGGGESPRARRVLEALEALVQLSPAEADLAGTLIRRVAAVESYHTVARLTWDI
jgi:hypothetical protein